MEDLWTLVQHSGFGYGNKLGFERAVEEARVETARGAEKIRRAGGIVFSDYGAADHAAEIENYPPENPSIYPRVRGEFHKTITIRGLSLYLPARALVTSRD